MPEPASIEAARHRIAPHIVNTPVLRNRVLDEIAGVPVHFKCENLQVGGAFKARGAFNAMLSVSKEEKGRGVVTHSSGNHAGAVAIAAQKLGIPAWIVVPSNISPPKLRQVRRTGAEIVLCEPTLEAREANAERIIRKTGAKLIHPYNDRNVIAGQGTALLELLDEVPGLEEVLVPVSGGGLLAGTAIAAKGFRETIGVTAVEPEGAADAWESFRQRRLVLAKEPKTIADGLRASLGSLTFPVLLEKVDRVVLVSEAGIVRAMRQLWEELRVIVEPSAAVPWAALLEGKLRPRGTTGIILTGGNFDVDRFSWDRLIDSE